MNTKKISFRPFTPSKTAKLFFPLMLTTLIGCNPLSLLPPRDLGDVLNLQGGTLTLESTTFVPQAVQANIAYALQSAADITDPRGGWGALAPNYVSVVLSFSAASLAGKCTAQNLDTLVITLQNGKITVKDDATGQSAAIHSAVNSDLILARDGINYKTANNSYVLSGGNLSDILGILISGGKNTVIMETALVSEENGLVGCKVGLSISKANLWVSWR